MRFLEGAQIVYLREMGSGGARKDLEAGRRAAAKSIRPGWSVQEFSSWRPKTTKPTVTMLRDEIKERAKGMSEQPRCGYWNGDRCIEWLETHEPVEPLAEAAEAAADDGDGGDDDADDEVPERRFSPQLSGEGLGEGAAALVPRRRWSAKTHIPLLVNVIVSSKEMFLARNQTVTRQCLDANDTTWYWMHAANLFNEADEELETIPAEFMKSHPNSELTARLGSFSGPLGPKTLNKTTRL